MASIDSGRIFEVDPDDLTDFERKLLRTTGSTGAAMRLTHIACAATLGDLIQSGGFEVVGGYACSLNCSRSTASTTTCGTPPEGSTRRRSVAVANRHQTSANAEDDWSGPGRI